MKNEKIKKIALVGLGSMGMRYLRLIKELRPEIKVIVVRSGKGKFCDEKLLATSYVSSIKEALTHGVNAAIICSPSNFHIQHASVFLKEGIPLLIEKPVSHNLDGIDDLKSLAKKNQVLILIGYVLRYSKGAQIFNKILKNHDFGQIISASIECQSYLPDWRPNQDYRQSVSACANLGGGVLLELSHEIDYANWFFGPFTEVNAFITNTRLLEIDVEDFANIKLRSGNNYFVNMHLDFCSKKTIRKTTVFGSSGSLVWDAANGRVFWCSNNGEREEWLCDLDRNEMYRSQLRHFFSCIEESIAPNVSFEDGVIALKIIEAARKSSLNRLSAIL